MTVMFAPDLVDFEAFARTPLVRDPFDHIVLPGFVPRDIAVSVARAFPGPDLPGVLPTPTEPPSDAFGDLLRMIRSPRMSDAFGEKFGLPLDPATMMVTLRARTRPIDGQIHTDSTTKVVTALIYLNTDWSDEGGRLRLLRGPNDLDDMVGEVPPVAGTLIAFRRTDRSWHGHKPFEGKRQAIMFNWMTDAAAARRELRRHAVSAGIKTLFHFG
jgi:SM-20-related protein